MKNLIVSLTILLSLFETKTLCKTVNPKTSEITTNICPDCTKYLIFCRVSEPGFVVELWNDFNKVTRNSNSSTDNSLAECVSAAYQIADLLEGSACFWSPKLGCHKVLGRREQERGFNDLNCLDCHSRCPCVNESSLLKGQMRLISILLVIILGINKLFIKK